MEAFITGADVDSDDVAFFKNNAFGGYAVDDHVVYRDTCAGRKPAVPEKAGHCAHLLDILADDFVRCV